MPRLENVGPAVDSWYEESGEGTSTFDVCNDCADIHSNHPLAEAGLEPYQSGEPSGELGDVDIMAFPYDESDYECAICGIDLTEENADDWAGWASHNAKACYELQQWRDA